MLINLTTVEYENGFLFTWDSIKPVRYRGEIWVWKAFFIPHCETCSASLQLINSEGDCVSARPSHVSAYGLHDIDPSRFLFTCLMENFKRADKKATTSAGSGKA